MKEIIITINLSTQDADALRNTLKRTSKKHNFSTDFIYVGQPNTNQENWCDVHIKDEDTLRRLCIIWNEVGKYLAFEEIINQLKNMNHG